MTEPKTKYPIESFGPELMAALLRGGREEVHIPFRGADGKRTAHNFQRRIHTLRRRMRELNHPDYLLATRARVSIFWGDRAYELDPKKYDIFKDDENGHKGAVIIIRPQDDQFRAYLKNAGITVTEHDQQRTFDSSVVPGREPTLDDLLDDLEQGK